VTAALILTGSPGSGKSSVLDALSTLLEIDGASCGAIESEQLARGWPWLKASGWIPQLAAIVALQKAAGRRLFLVVATTETELELEPDTWPGKLPLIAHARQLATSIPALPAVDVVLDTNGREATEIAALIREVLRDRHVPPARHSE
jgi:hypothetical protein